MNSRKIANLLAYVSVGLIAFSLAVSYLAVNVLHLSSTVAFWCEKVAYYLACLTTIISAFSYAIAKRNNSFTTFLVIFVIVIIIFTFVV